MRIRRNTGKIARCCRTSPAPFGGTLPKGEGMNLPVKLEFDSSQGIDIFQQVIKIALRIGRNIHMMAVD